MKYLTIEEVIFFNHMLISEHGGLEDTGVKSVNELESAINRPMATMFGNDLYPTVFHKASALFESLAKNHPFQNANKRTAFLSMVTFLEMNGYQFEMNQKVAEDFVVDVVVGKYHFEAIVYMIETHSHRIPNF